MSNRIRATAVLGLLALTALACSSSSDPGPDLTAGTFLVSMPQFTLPTPGPCDVAPFTLTVEKNGAGQAQVLVPQATFTCSGSPGGPFDFTLTDFSTAGDSLQMVLTYTQVNPGPEVTMRWHPGKTDLTGSAVFSLGAVGADTVTWTGVRQ